MTRAVLFDRDGTLIADAPPNVDPALVRLMPYAREALDLVRERGIRIGVISNQPAIARRTLTRAQMRAVNERIAELAGPIDGWFVCPHDRTWHCHCRKPRAGLVRRAARFFGVAPAECVVVGDIGTDVQAAAAANACGILVPTPATRREEIAASPIVCANLLQAVRFALSPMPAAA